MDNKKQIADSELPIMKVLWERGELTSPEIFENFKKNKSTLKTHLKRLVDKGVVMATEINSRTYKYSATITREEYTNFTRKSFLSKVFDGSRDKMLLNFIKEEKISRNELENLLSMIEED